MTLTDFFSEWFLIDIIANVANSPDGNWEKLINDSGFIKKQMMFQCLPKKRGEKHKRSSSILQKT